MAIGARDFIDRLLVEKYAQEQVDNHTDDGLKSRIEADDIMSALNQYSYNYRSYLDVSAKLNVACYSVNAKNAKYTQYETIPA